MIKMKSFLDRIRAFREAEEGIYDTLMKIYDISARNNLTTHKAASKVVGKRMQEVVKLKNIYLPKKM